jgi:hypothetical protein
MGEGAEMQFSNDGQNYSNPQPYAEIRPDWELSAGDGPKTVFAKFKDAAGNWSEACLDTIILDTAVPTTTDSGIDGFWHSSPVTVALTTEDSGSGVDKTYYSVDGSEPTVLYSGPFTLTNDGVYTIKYYSVDKAGNAEAVKTAAQQVKIDHTPPATPAVDDHGPHTNKTSELDASWNAEDAESGIVEYQYKITQDKPNGPEIKPLTSAEKNTSVKVKGLKLKDGKKYYFGVVAKNNAGLLSQMGYSKGITVVTLPKAPKKLTLQQVATPPWLPPMRGIGLIWQDNAKNEAGFEIERADGKGAFKVIQKVKSNTTKYLDGAGLKKGHTYKYRLRAYNQGGYSAYSNTASIVYR